MNSRIRIQLISVLFISILPCVSYGQGTSDVGIGKLSVSAKGTGRTTGHVADLLVTSKEKVPIDIQAQSVYIPSDGMYQPYVAEIPKTTIPPGITTVIPIDGFCADVHTPPVPNGVAMPPVDKWIPVGINTNPGSAVPILPHPPVPSFDPSDIPGISESPAFTVIPKSGPTPRVNTDPNTQPVPSAQPKTEPKSQPTDQPGKAIDPTGIRPTWPGTDKPIAGVINPDKDPKAIAPVLVGAINQITSAFDKLHEEGKISTPFTGDPEKEREAVIQQTFWIYTAGLYGTSYEKNNFQEKVFNQFESATGQKVINLPEPEKKKLDSGVDQFWNVFAATGVEAKVLSEPSHSTTTDPEQPDDSIPPVEIVAKGCSLEEKVTDTGPKLDYAIAETGTKGKNEKVKEAFKKAIEEAAGMISNAQGSDTVDVSFTGPQMPASAWSLYFPHVVAGQANATAFAVDTKNPLESAWTTDPLETKADGSRIVVLKHVMSDNCKSTLVGINFAKVRAASGLKASLGNIEALSVLNFVGEIAIDIAISKGKGTFKKLGDYLKDKTKDMAKDAAKDFIKAELNKLGKEWEGKSDEEAEKSMDELLKDIKAGDKGGEEESGDDFLNDWLAEILVEGEGIDPMDKITGDLMDKIDSPIDWSPIKTNTYAIGEGSLDVYVEKDHGVAKSASGVQYKREGLEEKEKAEKGGGIICDEGLASQTTSDSITLKTVGKTGSWAGATGEGIISTGHGIAIASLESFNGMYVIAICKCPEETLFDTFVSITGYSTDENMIGIWASMFERMMNDVADQLDKDIATAASKGLGLPANAAAGIQKSLEDAAANAAQYILPCDQGKK